MLTTAAPQVSSVQGNLIPSSSSNSSTTSILTMLGKFFAHTTLIERVYYKATQVRITLDLFRNDGNSRKLGTKHTTSDLYLIAPDIATAFVKPGPLRTANESFEELVTNLDRFYKKLKTQPPVRTKLLRHSWNEIDPIADQLFKGMEKLRKTKFVFKKSDVFTFLNSYNAEIRLNMRSFDQTNYQADLRACSIRALKTLPEQERAVIYAVRNNFTVPKSLEEAQKVLEDKLFLSGDILLIPDPKQEVGKKSFAQYGGVENVAVVASLPAMADLKDVATFLDTEADSDTASSDTEDSLLSLWGEYLTTLSRRGNITPSNMCVRIQSPVMRHAREYSLRRLMAYLDLVSFSPPMRAGSKTTYTYTVLPTFFRVSFTAEGLAQYVKDKDMSGSVYETFVTSVRQILRDNQATDPLRITNADLISRMDYKTDPLGGYDLDNFRKIAEVRGDLVVGREGVYFRYSEVPKSATETVTPVVTTPVVTTPVATTPVATTPVVTTPEPLVNWGDVVAASTTPVEVTKPPVEVMPPKVVSPSGRFESQPVSVTEADLPYMKRGPKFVEPPAPALKTAPQEGPLIAPYGVRTEAVLSMVRLKMSMSGKPVPMTDLCKVFESDLTSDQMWRVLKTLEEKDQVIISYTEKIPAIHAHKLTENGVEIHFTIPRDAVFVEYVAS